MTWQSPDGNPRYKMIIEWDTNIQTLWYSDRASAIKEVQLLKTIPTVLDVTLMDRATGKSITNAVA